MRADGAAILALLAAILLNFVAARPAEAHGLGMSQLRLQVNGAHLDGQWEIQLRDARRALGLDPQVLGDAGWRDVEGHGEALRTYLTGKLGVSSGGQPCPVELDRAPPEWEPGQEQVLFRLASTCAAEPVRLELRCDLLFDVDPMHRAYFSVEDARVTHVGVFRDAQRSVTVDVHQFHAWSTFTEFVREGVGHIASGVDHMLFLLALLLPAPLLRTGSDWSLRAGLLPTLREVVKVVTAFTLAHSLTLCLSFFGLVAPKAQWVEVAIALSVGAAAWNNLRPFLPGKAWAIALAFGLVHGLGFAGALKNLSLPVHARGLALAAFNVGVELGQLAIVAVVLPLLYAASRRAWYPRIVLGVGSFLIVWVAALWTIQRTFGLAFFA
jgi:hypothetical protein